MLPIQIRATGKALPDQVVSSLQLDCLLGKPAGYVEQRSGVHQRHFADDRQNQCDLAAAALRDAMQNACVAPDDIDLLISASAVPQQALPFMASLIMEPAGLPAGTAGFDVNTSCLSFLTALRVAASLLAAGTYRRIAIVCADLASRGLDWTEDSALILGDGAAAVIVERGDGTAGIVHAMQQTYPEGKTFCEIRAGGTQCSPGIGVKDADFKFHMQGRRVFRLMAELLPDFIERLLAPTGLTLDDIDLLIPHQASHLALAFLRERLGMDGARIVDIYAAHGNQVSASLPTALHEARRSGRVPAGSRILLLGSAAGVTIGGTVLIT